MSDMSRTTKAPSQRQLRAGELIRHELAQVLQRDEAHDETLSRRNITVTEVQTSPDLKHATVFVTTLGGLDVDGAVEALTAASGRLRRVLAPRLSLKFLPELRFKKDTSFDEAARIDDLLRKSR
ncbi:MAG: 30S ribosome-binding factor RbfA [Parvularcula sp.]|jgi:ribosome-binding factor A|nr:30S ribosome-binding factor RbfA [Parvularcula sp.]